MDFAVVHLDAGGGNDEAEELAAVAVEFALLAFDKQPMLAEAFEDLADVVVVFVGVRGKDEDVVEVDDDEIVQEIAEDVVHEGLEGGGGVGETEGHDKGFEVAVASAESGFPLVTLLDSYEVVGPTEVEFGEDLGTAEAVDGLSNEGKGSSVLDGNLVEASVVDTKSQAVVLLFDEEDRSACGRLGGLDEAFFEVLVEPVPESFEFRFGEGVKWSEGRLSAGFEVNGVVVGSVRGQFVGLLFGEHVPVLRVLVRDEVFVLRVFKGADGGDRCGGVMGKAEKIALRFGFFDEGLEGLEVDRRDIYGCWSWVWGRRFLSVRLGGKVQGCLCIPHGDQDRIRMTRMSEQDGVVGVIDVGIMATVPGNSQNDVDRRGGSEV